MEFFQGLLNGFKEYIYEKSLVESADGELLIVYTPYSYDLIDADLDFDEAYYSNHLLPNFVKLLNTEIINYLKQDDSAYHAITVHSGKMVFRSQVVKEKEIKYTLQDSKHVMVKTTTFEVC